MSRFEEADPPKPKYSSTASSGKSVAPSGSYYYSSYMRDLRKKIYGNDDSDGESKTLTVGKADPDRSGIGNERS